MAKRILPALALVLQVLVVHVPFLQTAFGTESLSGAQWLVCVALASMVLWLEELSKLVRRRGAGQRPSSSIASQNCSRRR